MEMTERQAQDSSASNLSPNKKRRCCLIILGVSVGLILVGGLVYWKLSAPPDPIVRMGSIQLGLKQSVSKYASASQRKLVNDDFNTSDIFKFPSKGGNWKTAHGFPDFTFRTYAPLAFRFFRYLFGISSDGYTTSICENSLRELSNPGASGEHLYLTSDKQFFLKTVSSKEAEFLQKILPSYYNNLQQNPKTLLIKYNGMYAYQAGQTTIRLVVMKNIFPSGVTLHLKFDLKGSTYGRKASEKERAKTSPTFKDLDFLNLIPDGIQLDPDTYTSLITTIERDCRVLESNNNMDYSLLLGIHNLDQAKRDLEREGSNQRSLTNYSDNTSRKSGIPATDIKGERLLIFVGIIDILQNWRLSKKVEHTFKNIITDGDTVSVAEPSFYARRFKEFMSNKVFRPAL